MQAVNASSGVLVAIYDKAGSRVGETFLLSDLYDSSACKSPGSFNPSVLYDEAADRWLLSGISSSGNICVAISRTADPSGAYWTHEVPTPEFSYVPRLGVGPDAYTVSAIESQPAVYALQRSTMLTVAA